MRLSGASCVCLLALGVVGMGVCPAAFADSYTEYDVAHSSGGTNNVGLTADGTLVVQLQSSLLYEAFTPPATRVDSEMPPNLAYDNGSACTPTTDGGFTYFGRGVCNNGRELFTAAVGERLYVYDGPSVDDLVFMGDAIGLLLNAEGDFAFVTTTAPTAEQTDVNKLYIASTPEPGSIMLLGTGLLGMAGVVRRRVGC